MLSRRSFLKYMAGVTAFSSISFRQFVPALASVPYQPFADTRLLMGTFVTIHISGVSSSQAEDAAHMTFLEMGRLENLLTRFDGSSPLGILNSSGILNDVPAELYAVLDAARYIHRYTCGAFDPTVLPLLECAKDDSQAWKETESLIGFDKVLLSDRSICFSQREMRMSLDGIAKGYIADAAAQQLLALGISDFLVDAGGDMVAHGSKNGIPWRVAIESPEKYLGNTAWPTVCSLTHGAIATSGNYESGTSYGVHGHLINPKSRTASSVQSATVIASRAVDADALATALCVMPDPVGFMQSAHNIAGCLIMADGSVYKSKNWG